MRFINPLPQPVSGLLIAALLAAAPALHADTARHYQIPAGTLDQALNRYAAEAGLVLVINAELTRDKRSNGIAGSFQAEDGLRDLLTGSGLELYRQANGSYALRKASTRTVPPAAPAARSKAAPDAEPPRTLAQVVVTSASGFEQTVADAPASISVITRQDLEGKHYRDLTDALQDIPGVSIEGGSGGKIESTSINIRGFGEDYALFLVDGKPLGSSSQAYYNGFGGAAQVGWLPPVSAIERIEVIRGPMSSLYGSSALGGVINIITKKVTDRWAGSVSLDTVIPENQDAADSWQARYHLSGPLLRDKLALTVYGSRYNRDEDRYTSGFAEKRSADDNVKLTWTPTATQSLSLEAGQAAHDNQRTARTGAAGEMNNERSNFGISHAIRWGDNLETTSFITREAVEIENGTVYSEYFNTVANTRTVIPLKSHMITVGAEHKEERTDHDASRFPGSITLNLKRWQRALFVEDEYFLTKAFSVTGGVRLDENEHYGSEVIPRLYGVYRANESLIFKGGISGGYKAPTLKQADDNIVENAGRGRSWDKGNSNLKPENSINYEAGVTYLTHAGLTTSLTVYHTRFEDKIGKEAICTSPPGVPSCTYNGMTRESISQYINLDSAELQGVEAALSMPVGPVKLNTSYTYSRSEVTSGANKGDPLNNLPRHMLNVGADWRASDRLNVWSKARYKSSTVEDGANRYPHYTLVDAGVNYRLNQRVSLYSGIYNLLDKDVESTLYGKTLDGRRLFAGITLSF